MARFGFRDAPHQARSSRWRALAVWVTGVGIVSALLAVPWMALASLRLERDAMCLRDALVGGPTGRTMGGWSPRFEVRLGGTAFGLVRLVMCGVELPEEARRALRAARSASVGVYQWRGADLEATARHLTAGPDVLRRSGRTWMRVVSVCDGDGAVVVFTPVDGDAGGDSLELCVVVLADGELVMATAEVDPQALSDLVQPHLREWRERM